MDIADMMEERDELVGVQQPMIGYHPEYCHDLCACRLTPE
jgi:hypothetical protein